MLPSRRTWIYLVVADVAIWLIADSQDTALLALRAHGTFLTILQVLWVLSLLAFIVLMLLGAVMLFRSQGRARST